MNDFSPMNVSPMNGSPAGFQQQQQQQQTNETSRRRVWTSEEDEKLRELVKVYGDKRGKTGNWDQISAHLAGRTNKDCRKRWFHSLDPNLKRGKWTKAEDEILLRAFETHGGVWHQIAKLIPGRTDDQCSKRYNDVLDPRISDRLRKWAREEDEALLVKIRNHGTSWRIISNEMEGRTGLTCRNRWRKLMAQYIRQRDLHKDTPPMTVIQHMASDAELQHIPWGEYKNVSLKEEHLSSDEDDDDEEQTSPGWGSPGQPQQQQQQQQQQQGSLPQQPHQNHHMMQQAQIHGGQLPHMMQQNQPQVQPQQQQQAGQMQPGQMQQRHLQQQQQPPQQQPQPQHQPPTATGSSTATSTSTTTTTTTYKTKHQRNIPGVSPSASGVELTADAMAYLRELFLSSEKELVVEVHHVTHIHNHTHNLTLTQSVETTTTSIGAGNLGSNVSSSVSNTTPTITPTSAGANMGSQLMPSNDVMSDQYSYQQFFNQPVQQGGVQSNMNSMPQGQQQGNMHDIHEHDIDGAMAMLYGEDFGLELDEGPKRLPGGHPFRGLPFAPS
ncbi:Myb-like DNA-binding protein BAS1 [Yarrowia sp. C11]|nr:Myb-like DNA-binding protein BAS1 [Yarrowia sp. E02]KAG5372764.1 Myb-like DNA-binding protein BAS1 [Yarrowia sp. C11]